MARPIVNLPTRHHPHGDGWLWRCRSCGEGLGHDTNLFPNVINNFPEFSGYLI